MPAGTRVTIVVPCPLSYLKSSRVLHRPSRRDTAKFSGYFYIQSSLPRGVGAGSQISCLIYSSRSSLWQSDTVHTYALPCGCKMLWYEYCPHVRASEKQLLFFIYCYASFSLESPLILSRCTVSFIVRIVIVFVNNCLPSQDEEFLEKKGELRG